MNVLKGQWQESDSPLRVDVRGLAARAAGATAASGPRSRGWARCRPTLVARSRSCRPPSRRRRCSSTSRSSPTRRARGAGRGARATTRPPTYIAERFKAFGLAPGGARRVVPPAVHDARRNRRVKRRPWRTSIGYIPGHEGGVEEPVGRGDRALRSPRTRLAGRAQGRRGQGAPRRGRQRERRGRDARTRARAERRREAVALDRVRRVHRRGERPARARSTTSSTAAGSRRPGHRRHQPRHRRPPGRPEAVGDRHRHGDRVAAHLPRRELRDRRREPERRRRRCRRPTR